MHILVDIRHLNQPKPSGVGEYTKQILRALFAIDRKNRYTLLSTGKKKYKALRELAIPPHINHVHIPISNKRLNLSLLLRHKPHLDALAGSPVDLAFFPNLNFAAFSKEIPLVLTIHDLSFLFHPEFYSKKMRLWHKAVKPEALIARSTEIITPSVSTKEDVARFYKKPASAISVIPHGKGLQFRKRMDASDHGIRSKLKLPKRFALFLGTLEPRKNLLAVIQAVEAYRARTGDNLFLVLAGGSGWESKDIKHLIRQPDHANWIQRLGYIPDCDRAVLYRAATVTIWPSLYEGFGLPVLESMACGTPVITSTTSSLPEISGGAALCVDPYNPADISAALESVMKDPALRERLSNTEIAQAERFSWQKAAEETLRVFERAAHEDKNKN